MTFAIPVEMQTVKARYSVSYTQDFTAGLSEGRCSAKTFTVEWSSKVAGVFPH